MNGPAKPLPAHSPLLRKRRYEANVLGLRNERGGRACLDSGRFTSHQGARDWADDAYPDAEVVNITFYSEATGWVPKASGQRKNGVWS